MNLHDAAQPLIDQPPHPAPPITEIATRARRRTVRRRSALGVLSAGVLAVGLAGAATRSPTDEPVELRTAPPPVSSTSIQSGTTTPAAPVIVDLTAGLGYGGRSLQEGSRIVLPDEVVILDDDTVALAWSAPCNQPAETAIVDTAPDEIEIRLSLTTIPVSDCVGQSDRWVTTFELPETIGARRVQAVADVDGQRRTRDASSDGRVMPVESLQSGGHGGTPVAAQVRIDDDPTTADVVLPATCVPTALTVWQIGNVIVPDLRLEQDPMTPCGPASGQPLPVGALDHGRLIGAE